MVIICTSPQRQRPFRYGSDIHLVRYYSQTALLWVIREFSAGMALRMCAGVALAQMSWQLFDAMGYSGPSIVCWQRVHHHHQH